ncbi:MAG TPA: L,D-transpeptidase [Polyangiaceae bacterium]|nr:L,D-transpeptidase [Polyangiaceae bacterium]
MASARIDAARIDAAQTDGASIDTANDAAPSGTPDAQLGRVSDNLPFTPSGLRLGSIALRTWIYSDTGPKRTRYGYLRAGSIVDARGPAMKNEGCPGGWYRINPRGFVCVGMGATLELNHPVLVAANIRPVRKAGLPYLYAKAGKTPPYFYFRLPSVAQMQASEGERVTARAAVFRERALASGLKSEPPPEFLQGGRKLEKPYGSKEGLHFSAHSGQAAPDSGFSITRVIDWQNRLFGLTTELELLALDRTKLVVPSQFHGVELGPDEGLPVGFVEPRFAPKYVLNSRAELVQQGAFEYREGLKLTGAHKPGAMLEAAGGVWVPESVLRKIAPRTSFPSVATGDRKWIDISIRDQTLVAYVGRRPVYVTLVSTGRGGMGDPETTLSTVRGSFMIYQKDTSSTMDGEQDSAADSYALRDVPFVQYFHKGFALHGTYWHDEFGRVRSHGCVNLSPVDAAWLFEWTDPSVPPDWHGVINKDRGTVVFIRP